MWWSVFWSPVAKGFVTLQGTLILPLCCADGVITTHTWRQWYIIFAKQIVLHKPLASVLQHQHCWGESTEKWELETTAVHSDWECITSLWTLLCFEVQLQTKGHQAQNLLVNISKASFSLKDRKSSASHLVCVFPVYLHASLFLFSFWSRQDSVKILPLLREKMGFCSGFSQQAEFFWA